MIFRTPWFPAFSLIAATSPVFASAMPEQPTGVAARIRSEAAAVIHSLGASEARLTLIREEERWGAGARIMPTLTVKTGGAHQDQIDIILSVVVILTNTATTTWPVPADFTGLNKIETVGAGGSGGAFFGNSGDTTGGGGGGYSNASNTVLTPGANITVQIGTGGSAVVSNSVNVGATGNAGTDTYFQGTSLATSTIGAQGGGAGQQQTLAATSGGTGGAAASGKGTVTNSGGRGGNTTAVQATGSGGGGAAGPNGNGNNGVDLSANAAGTAGGSGDNGAGGTGGTPITGTGTGTAGSGGSGTEWTTAGSGGGGGGAATTTTSSSITGGAGGNYGGGGGGCGGRSPCTSGAGANGLIVITYAPFAKPINRIIYRRR